MINHTDDEIPANVTLYHNALMNPEAACELEAPQLIRGYALNATLNFWGHADEASILSR